MSKMVIRNLILEGAPLELALASALGGAAGLVLGKAFDTPPGVVTLAAIGGTLLGAGIFAASAHRAVRRVAELEVRAIPETSPHFALDPETAPIAEIVAYLRHHLGVEVTAFISGVDSPPLVGHWASGAIEPEPLASARLRFGYKTVRFIVSAYDGETACAWLFGMNDRLGDEAPIGALREGESPEDWVPVVEAAEEFVEFVR